MLNLALQAQAASEFVNLVYTWGNGTDLSQDDIYNEVARAALITFYIGPHREPDIALQEWFVAVGHTELLYMLLHRGLLDDSLLTDVERLVRADVAAGNRDARDLRHFG